MTCTIIGFVLGLLIPYIARRFAKIMLQTPTLAYALYYLLYRTKKASRQKRLSNHKYIQLRNRYFMRSFGWGIISVSIIFLLSTAVPSFELPWLTFFVLSLLILTEIDKRIQFLPDIITFPLLIVGFSYAVFSGALLGNTTVEAVENSSLGTLFGYMIPVIASLLLIKKHPDNFGGGDIKLLAAIGAWLGIANIPHIILLSCLFFAISFLITKKRVDAFGPSIVFATLTILFSLIYY